MLPRIAPLILLAAALPLAGCEMITGEKAKDGESVGYACRVSNKSPEECMKENSAYTPTSILGGWKTADKDVKDKKVDTQFGKKAAPAGGETPAEGEAKPEGEQPPAEAQSPPPEPTKH
jgi:hypothetical protein